MLYFSESWISAYVLVGNKNERLLVGYFVLLVIPYLYKKPITCFTQHTVLARRAS